MLAPVRLEELVAAVAVAEDRQVLDAMAAILTPIARGQPRALAPDHLHHLPAVVADFTADHLRSLPDPDPGRGLLQAEDAVAVEAAGEEVPPRTTIATVAVVPGA